MEGSTAHYVQHADGPLMDDIGVQSQDSLTLIDRRDHLPPAGPGASCFSGQGALMFWIIDQIVKNPRFSPTEFHRKDFAVVSMALSVQHLDLNISQGPDKSRIS